MHVRDEKAWQFDVSPQEDRVVFMGDGQGDQDLFVLNLKNWKVTRLTDTPDYESSPVFSPDGKSVVYAADDGDRADHIFSRTLDGKTIHQLTNVDYNDHSPTFSPDGQVIVFARDNEYITGGQMRWGTWQDSQLYAVTTDGTRLRQLTQGISSTFDSPQFSNDGKQIAFVFNNERRGYSPFGKIGTMAYSPNGVMQPVKSLTAKANNSAPTFLPDNKHILFFSSVQDNCYTWHDALFFMDSNGRGAHPIAQKINALSAVFSANRKHLYFILYPQYSLWHMDVDGRNCIKIADSTLFKNPLEWKPQNPPPTLTSNF